MYIMMQFDMYVFKVLAKPTLAIINEFFAISNFNSSSLPNIAKRRAGHLHVSDIICTVLHMTVVLAANGSFFPLKDTSPEERNLIQFVFNGMSK